MLYISCSGSELTFNFHLEGVQLVLWASCALYLWKQRQRGKKTGLLLCYITLLLVVETIFGIVQARTVQVIYIDNRNYPGGPWQYFLDTQSLAINVMFYATLFVITFLCDLLVVRTFYRVSSFQTHARVVVMAVLGYLECLWAVHRLRSHAVPIHPANRVFW